MTPIYIAARYGAINVIKFFLEPAGLVNPIGSVSLIRESRHKTEPLYEAIENRHLFIVELLLEHEATPSYEEACLLIILIIELKHESNTVKILQLLYIDITPVVIQSWLSHKKDYNRFREINKALESCMKLGT